MARMSTNGIDGLALDLAELAHIPDSVQDDMLNAQADVIADEQHRTARSMGVYDTGVTSGSIKKTKPKKGKDGRQIEVYPQGTNADGNRNAEVAFINEFGKTGQPARPFIKTANEQATDRAVAASEKVYHAWLDRKNL